MVVPYTNVNNYNIVSKILKCVMNACAQRVAKLQYQGAMLKFLEDSETWTSEHTKTYYRSLWLSSVWLMVTELCREEMTPKRISKLSYSLFGDFMQVYQDAKNFPNTEVWEEYQKETAASKGHNPPASLEHFAGVDVKPNIAQLQPGTPGTPGTQGEAAAKRKAGTIIHIIPPATSMTPAPNSAATLSTADRKAHFFLNMRRDPTSVSEMHAFEEFERQFDYPPNKEELPLWAHLISTFPEAPTVDQFKSFKVLYESKGGIFPTDIEFKKFHQDRMEEKARRAEEAARELASADVQMRASIGPARDW
jgi:hypothetical protein